MYIHFKIVDFFCISDKWLSYLNAILITATEIIFIFLRFFFQLVVLIDNFSEFHMRYC